MTISSIARFQGNIPTKAPVRFGEEKTPFGVVIPGEGVQNDIENTQALNYLYAGIINALANPVELGKAMQNSVPLPQRAATMNNLAQALSTVLTLAKTENIKLSDYRGTLASLDNAGEQQKGKFVIPQG